MCAMNFFKEMRSMNYAHNDITIIVKKLCDLAQYENVIEVPISYFVLNTSINKLNIYKAFHELQTKNVIEKLEYIQCDECLHEEKVIYDREIHKCRRCGCYFNEVIIVEKFRLKGIKKYDFKEENSISIINTINSINFDIY